MSQTLQDEPETGVFSLEIDSGQMYATAQNNSIETSKRKHDCSLVGFKSPCTEYGASMWVTESRGKRPHVDSSSSDDDNAPLATLLRSSRSDVGNGEDHIPLIDLVDSPPVSPVKGDSSLLDVIDLCSNPSSPAARRFDKNCSIAHSHVTTTTTTDAQVLSTGSQDIKSAPLLKADHQSSAKPVPSSEPQKKKRYTLKSSAYLQNLAEMCFIITQDCRWRRASDTSQTLLRWEDGDDLKMIESLCRQYTPPPPKIAVACPCLLCRNHPTDTVERKAGNTKTKASLDSHQNQDNPGDKDEEDTRRLYLLSRLFYRKGPWFRLDDVYQRYYAPEKIDKATGEGGSCIDVELLQHQMEIALPNLLSDIRNLLHAGMIRGFEGEAECGKTIDAAVLTVEERGIILTKLGGNKKKKAEDTRVSVWKQMTTQKGLFTGNGLLPVIRHVELVMLDKLARLVVLSCSSSKEVSTRDLRMHTEKLKPRLTQLCKKIFVKQRMWHLCFRLAEKPLLALRRCVRLFCCATSGPGDMRGNGTNGWRSTLVAPALPKKTAILPPGQHSWHDIRYPGLEHRFGLRSAPFFHTYQHLSFSKVNQLKDDCVQVFSSGEEFRRWELCVEIRSFVDYAIEFEDAVRYDQRRIAKGKDPVRGCATTSFIDSLDVLSEHGRIALLRELLGVNGDQLGTLKGQAHPDDNFENQSQCSQALISLGIVIIRTLTTKVSSDVDVTPSPSGNRPWLRHLCWKSCLAYVLWDIIPIVERACYYVVAIQALQVLLTGTFDTEESIRAGNLQVGDSHRWSSHLSRRARGKAIDRLVIDYSHIFRLGNSKLVKKEKKSENDLFQQRLVKFSYGVITRAAPLSAFGFSSIRTIARRLKKPLVETLRGVAMTEAQELGIRIEPDAPQSIQPETKYIDWEPITDVSVANAIAGQSDPGSRCSFVGHDDSNTRATSLNVEEYALEMYGNGRLPVFDDESLGPDDKLVSGGGWAGWHNEGAHLRALFRLLCSGPILGAGFGCMIDLLQNSTVYLSPYQESPFDLHVGFELRKDCSNNDHPVASKGIYFRRSATIQSFLHRLELCDTHMLTDLVYDSVKTRLEFAHMNSLKDPTLERDLQQVRTLSCLAAGLGGKVLSRAFRCMLYDYRHYSGGLPDLQLIRASKRTGGGQEVIDLEWIGESFSKEKKQEEEERRSASILFDKDDEYLGCAKIGDFQANRRSSRPPGSQKSKPSLPQLTELPERLRLVHNGSPVEVQSMLVEVKSSSDRLDPRQEDWLNILSDGGLARVCKFEDNRKGKRKAA